MLSVHSWVLFFDVFVFHAVVLFDDDIKLTKVSLVMDHE